MNYFSYFSEIEETFNRRRGKHLFLSPLDWALIETWQQRGVPLHIVLRGIEKVFDTADAKPKRLRTVKSLMYCREEIEAQHEEWLERQVGKNVAASAAESDAPSEEFSGEAIAEFLKDAQSKILAARDAATGDLRDALERACARLADLLNDFTDAESLEGWLADIEKAIDAELLKTPAAENYKKEIEKQLATYKSKMETDAYRQTFDLMLLKRLRETARVPRLSLFYL